MSSPVIVNQAQKIRALSLTVGNLTQAQRFYQEALGFEVIAHDSFHVMRGEGSSSDSGFFSSRVATLRLGQELIRLVEHEECESQPIPADSQSHDLWFQHFAIVVTDVDRAYDHLKSFGIRPISSEPQTIPQDNPTAGGVRAYKFRDPEGHALELIQFPPGKGDARWHQQDSEIQSSLESLFLGIDHTAIAVVRTAENLDFYETILGFEVKSSTLQHGAVQSNLDGVEDAEVQVTALSPAQTSIGLEFLDYHRPDNGRPIPASWNQSSLALYRLELEVQDLAQLVAQLQDQPYRILPLASLSAPHPFYPDQQLYRAYDPTGREILLIERSNSQNSS